MSSNVNFDSNREYWEDKISKLRIEKVLDNDGYVTYKILCENTQVGELDTIEDDRDYIFGRQVEIFENYQGHGLGTHVIDEFITEHSDKHFRFCIATNSDKAVDFWQFYLEATKNNKKHIRSEIWEIWK
jgi:predicted acetyltransferase